MTVATLAAYTSGLWLVAPDLDPPTMLGTGLALNMCYAAMCRLIAGNNGRATAPWTVVGFTGGLWSVAVLLLLLLPRREGEPPPQIHPFP